mmetsp:Transcript_41713/g.108022  ORF Transcript_41713/g.108022 Transcript_41713/m.108022 type:complete len:769 (-) Transcript_41713:123-2429(-)
MVWTANSCGASHHAARRHGAASLPPGGRLDDTVVHRRAAALEVQGRLDLLLVVGLHDVALEDLDVLATVVAEHAEVLGLLHLNVLQAAVHDVVLLQLQEFHIPRDRGEHELQQEPREEDHVLEVEEQGELLREGPALVLGGRKNQQEHVGCGCEDAVDLERGAPRLVAARSARNGALLVKEQVLPVDVDLQEDADERREADPLRGHGEERPEAVRDQDLVEVVEERVVLLLGLLLRRRHVGQLQERVVAEHRDDRAAVAAAAPPELQRGLGVLPEVGHRDAEDHEHRELRLQVQEAVAVQAIHLRAEEVRVTLEEGRVVQHKVGHHELEDHHLREHVRLVLRLRAVVLARRQPPRQRVQAGVPDLHQDRNGELEREDAAGHLGRHVVPHVDDHQEDEDQQDTRQQHHRPARRVMLDAVPPVVEGLHLRGDRVDARLAVVLRAARLEGLDEVQRAPADGVLGLLPAPEVRQERAPDAHQDAEGDGGDVVRRRDAEVDEPQDEADDRNRHHPLPVEAQEQEVEGDLVAEVVVDLVGMILGHQDPSLPVVQILDGAALVQREVSLQLVLVQQVPDVDAGAVLVFGRDDVVDDEDLVERLEDRVRVGEVVLRVRLVDVRDDSAILELGLGPAREVAPVLGVGVQVLLLQLKLVLHPRRRLLQLGRGRADLDQDLVAVAAVVAEEVEAAVLQALEDRVAPLLPHLLLRVRERVLLLVLDALRVPVLEDHADIVVPPHVRQVHAASASLRLVRPAASASVSAPGHAAAELVADL